METEEYRRKALECYHKSSNEMKAYAMTLFNQMDSDGDSRIDVAEFAACARAYKFIPRNGHEDLFKRLDRSGDGILDFNEFVTFFYAVCTENRCDGCQKRLINQSYLTCGTCFAARNHTFDICSTCFSSKNFAHQHSDFLDYSMILVFESIALQGDQKSTDEEDVREAFTEPKMETTTTDPGADPGTDWGNSKTKTVLQLAPAASAAVIQIIAALATGSCSIM